MNGPMPDYTQIAEDALRHAPLDSRAEKAHESFLGYLLFAAVVGQAVMAHRDLTRGGKPLRLDVNRMSDAFDLSYGDRRVYIKSLSYDAAVKISYTVGGRDRTVKASNFDEVTSIAVSEIAEAVRFLLG